MSHQDAVGPMARSVADAALILSAMAGRDPRDNYTLAQPAAVSDYTKALRVDALRGARLGVPRNMFADVDADVLAAFNDALDIIEGLGATIVDPADLPDWDEIKVSENETIVAMADFKVS